MEYNTIKNLSDNGVDYTLDVVNNKWQPRIFFWLGFRPFDATDLTDLIGDITVEQLMAELRALQNLRIINPLTDVDDKYSLTEDGQHLRNVIISAGVWSRQQIDETAGLPTVQIVEPERDADMNQLLKFRRLVENYL